MVGKRPATAEEMKALANPLRLRILRLCLDQALTNKEIADHLAIDPGTVLHHVRLLVETGFLAPEPVRRGARGSIERPYRATGKSWTLEITDAAGNLALVDAFRGELAAGDERDVLMLTRLGTRLRAADLHELGERLGALVLEFKDRDHPRGKPLGLMVGLHRRREPKSERGRRNR